MNPKLIALLLSILFIPQIAFHLTEENVKLLSGTWYMAGIKLPATATQDQKAYLQNQIEPQIKGVRIRLNTNHTFTADTGTANTVIGNGNWSVDVKAGTMTDDLFGEKQVVQILNLTTDTLEIKDMQPGQDMSYIWVRKLSQH